MQYAFIQVLVQNANSILNLLLKSHETIKWLRFPIDEWNRLTLSKGALGSIATQFVKHQFSLVFSQESFE